MNDNFDRPPRPDTSSPRGIALIEMLVYMAVLLVFMNILTDLFRRGMELATAAQGATFAIQEAEATLAIVRQDLREAIEIQVPSPALSSGEATIRIEPESGLRLRLRRADGAVVVYRLKGDRLVRQASGGPTPSESRLSGRFADFAVAPVPEAPAVLRIDLSLLLAAGSVPGPGRATAHFSTAVKPRLHHVSATAIRKVE